MWLTGDANGNLKRITSTPASEISDKHPELRFSLVAEHLSLHAQDPPPKAIQRLSAHFCADLHLVAAAYADGKTSLYDSASIVQGHHATSIAAWTEPLKRFIPTSDTWVGLDVTVAGVLQCTQKGQVRFTSLDPAFEQGKSSAIEDLSTDRVKATRTCNVPINLRHFKAEPSGSHFAYAGREVNLSLWNTEVAFGDSKKAADSTKDSGKRSRESLFPGEIWRAKNVSNDSLDLRQPVDITSLAFLDCDTSTRQYHHLVVGNTLGYVHRYDSRKGRKAVGSWQDRRMAGGISLVQKGLREHELYIADCGTNLWAVDMRKPTGPLYAYKGFSGMVASLSASARLDQAAAGSLDRYFRLLTPIPNENDVRDARRHGSVAGKLYVTAAPTAIVPLELEASPSARKALSEMDGGEREEVDEDFDDMQEISSEDDSAHTSRKRRRKA